MLIKCWQGLVSTILSAAMRYLALEVGREQLAHTLLSIMGIRSHV